MEEKIALVTGANKGIGFEVAKQLASKNVAVILTARSESKGIKVYEELQKNYKNIFFHQLDVTDEKSIKAVYDFVEQTFGRLDILINNAGIFIKEDREAIDVSLDTLRKTIETNTFGALRLSQTFIPLMKKNNYGRIVNVSSGMGAFTDIGKGSLAYRISKASLNMVTGVLASEVYDNILVNSVCPGWVRTDMGGSNASRDVEKGAETVTWLALLPNDGPTGKFFRDKKQISW